MKCQDVSVVLEEYIRGGLSPAEAQKVASHLTECTNCDSSHRELAEVINGLSRYRDRICLAKKESEVIRQMFASNTNRKSGFLRWFQYGVAAAALTIFALTGLLFMSPALAAKIVPTIPLVKEMLVLKQENTDLKDKLQVFTQTDNGLDPVQDLSEQEKFEVQNTVLSFVKAQYQGDRAQMAELASREFAAEMEQDSSLVPVYGETVSLNFVIITNTVKMEGRYLTFVRLEDSQTDSQYQENFYLEKVDGEYKIIMVELDV